MPLRKNNTRVFHRALYCGELEKIRLLHHNDDFHASTITASTLFNCRRGPTQRGGEPIQGDMMSSHTCFWFIPRVELARVGVDHINMINQIIQLVGREAGWTWQPEADTSIELKLFGNQVKILCKRADPTISDVLLGIAHAPEV